MHAPVIKHPSHDDVIKWKHFPRNLPFVRGIHRSPVNSLHKGQWRGVLMFPLICARINGWVNNREAGDLRRYRAHYDVIVMKSWLVILVLTTATYCLARIAVTQLTFIFKETQAGMNVYVLFAYSLTATLCWWIYLPCGVTLEWRHNERDGISNHQPRDCLLNGLFRCRSKKTSFASLAFVRGIHQWPVNSAHKGPVTRNMFPFDDVIM